jgi:hypothetical protein
MTRALLLEGEITEEKAAGIIAEIEAAPATAVFQLYVDSPGGTFRLRSISPGRSTPSRARRRRLSWPPSRPR